MSLFSQKATLPGPFFVFLPAKSLGLLQFTGVSGVAKVDARWGATMMMCLQWKNLFKVKSRQSFLYLLRVLSQLGWRKQLLLVSRTRQIESWSVREESPQNRAFRLVHNRKSNSRLTGRFRVIMLNDGVGCTVWNFRDTQFVRHSPLKILRRIPRFSIACCQSSNWLRSDRPGLNFRQPSFAQAPLDIHNFELSISICLTPFQPLFWAALAAIVGFCTLFMTIYVYHDWSVGKWKICFHIWCVMMIRTCSCLGSTSVLPRSVELGRIVRLCKNIRGYKRFIFTTGEVPQRFCFVVLILPQTNSNMTFFKLYNIVFRTKSFRYRVFVCN